MTKKKKILNGIIFLVGLIVFLFYYFEDKTDTEVIEEKHKESATESADTTLNVLDNIVTDDLGGMEDGNFAATPSTEDSNVKDGL